MQIGTNEGKKMTTTEKVGACLVVVIAIIYFGSPEGTNAHLYTGWILLGLIIFGVILTLAAQSPLWMREVAQAEPRPTNTEATVANDSIVIHEPIKAWMLPPNGRPIPIRATRILR